MKKTFLLSCTLVFSLLFVQNCQAQQHLVTGGDTTIASFRDTLRNYTYQNVYAIITGINLNRGNNGMTGGASPIPFTSKINTDSMTLASKRWKGSVGILLFSAKDSYTSGKQPIANISVNIVLSERLPVLGEILSKAVAALSKNNE